MVCTKRQAAALIIILLHKRKRQIKRNIWVRKWLLRRSTLGAYSQLYSELKIEDPIQLQNFARTSSSDLDDLINLVGPLIAKKDTRMRDAISVSERVLVTLRYLATGDSYMSLSYLFRISKSTISNIIYEVCQGIATGLKDYLKAPATKEEWSKVAYDFERKWNFPQCLGALDGKHVTIQAAPNSGSYFFNYKGFHSIVLLALIDANYKFLLVDIGCNGRISDGGVFAASAMPGVIQRSSTDLPKTPLPGRRLAVPYVIVADDAFPLQENIMKPYSTINTPGPARIYNYRLSRARRIVENVFGILSSVFRVLRKPILIKPERTDSVILAVCTLHNYLMSKKNSRKFYAPENVFDKEINDCEVVPGSWRLDGYPDNNLLRLSQQGSNNYSSTAKEIRDEFRDYFNSPEGEVPWQYKYI